MHYYFATKNLQILQIKVAVVKNFKHCSYLLHFSYTLVAKICSAYCISKLGKLVVVVVVNPAIKASARQKFCIG